MRPTLGPERISPLPVGRATGGADEAVDERLRQDIRYMKGTNVEEADR